MVANAITATAERRWTMTNQILQANGPGSVQKQLRGRRLRTFGLVVPLPRWNGPDLRSESENPVAAKSFAMDVIRDWAREVASSPGEAVIAVPVFNAGPPMLHAVVVTRVNRRALQFAWSDRSGPWPSRAKLFRIGGHHIAVMKLALALLPATDVVDQANLARHSVLTIGASSVPCDPDAQSLPSEKVFADENGLLALIKRGGWSMSEPSTESVPATSQVMTTT